MADCQYDWSTTICARAEKKNIISNLRQACGPLQLDVSHVSCSCLCVGKLVMGLLGTTELNETTHCSPPLLKPVR